MDIAVLFAVLLIYFTINKDWSKAKKGTQWFPYFFIVFLTMFIFHRVILTFAGINVFDLLKEKIDVSNFIKTKLLK